MTKEGGIALKLSKVFGFQQEVKGSLGFSGHNTLFYLSGRRGVHHKLKRSCQKFSTIPEENEITALAFGANHTFAIASKGSDPVIGIFNLKTNEKKTLPTADRVISDSYVWVSFSHENTRVGAQGGRPDRAFALWQWEKKRLEIVFHPFRMEPGAEVFKFHFCPFDALRVVAVGRFFLREYHYKNEQRMQEKALHDHERSQRCFHSAAWIRDTDRVAVGTSNGQILVFENMHLVRQVTVAEELTRIRRSIETKDQNVTCILLTAKGLLCSYGTDSVLCFDEDFNLQKMLNIPDPTDKSRIIQLAKNFQEDRIAAATKDGRLLSYCFADRRDDKDCEDDFGLIQDYQHTGRVICADSMQSVSLQATCSETDIILRNFVTGEVILLSPLSATPRSVSACPLATSVAIGFDDSVKVFNIVLDSLTEAKCFEDATDSQVAYSPAGHLLALTENFHVHLYYSVGFQELTSFRKHHGKVWKLLWRHNNSLMSSDDAGEVYEWDIPKKRALWKLSVPGVTHTALATPDKVLSEELYVASSDSKIRLVRDGVVRCDYDLNGCKIAAMIATDEIVLAGSEDGKLLAFPLSLRVVLFEVHCHVGSILHLATFHDAASVTAVDVYGVVSTWTFQDMTFQGQLPSREEVLIDINKLEENIQRVREMKANLHDCTQKSNALRKLQESIYESKETEASESFTNIQRSLQATIEKLEKEKAEILADLEQEHSQKLRIIEKEKEDNESDFQKKMSDEQACMQRAREERDRMNRDLGQLVSRREDEKRAVVEEFEVKYSRYQNKVRELEEVFNKERNAVAKIKREREDLSRQTDEKLPDGTPTIGPETYSDIRIDAERSKYEEEMENVMNMFNYEKECCLSIEEEFKRKHKMQQQLQDVARKLKFRVNRSQTDIARIEGVLNNKSDFSRQLQEEAAELSTEGDLKMTECEEQLQMKKKELAEVQQALQKCKASHKEFSAVLKARKREETLLNERLKSTEKNVVDHTKRLLEAVLRLERYRTEFVNITSACPSASALRWAMLKLYEKRVVTAYLKEETVTFADMDPYVRFCKKRNHYESLINVARNRTSQVRETFREKFVKLAKENSDWTAFAEALREDIRQKKDRIRFLEDALGIKAEEFGRNPAETQRRLWQTAETLSRLEAEEGEQIRKRLALVEEQQKEVQRLHGLLTVDERGKIVRKMR